MGLRLVRRLVELHGGSVSAESGGEGKGSEFTVRLPAAEREAEADRQRPTPAREPATGQPRRRVLVIDDAPDVLKTYHTVLKLWGHEVYAAETGPSGIEAARKFRPEVVLVDIGLPGIDGYEVAKRLRAEPELEPLILVAVTGYGQPKDRQRSEQAGFNHHLVKPDVLEDLATILKQR